MATENGSLIAGAAATIFGSESDMFEAAVSKFVKTVGKESLTVVPSLDEANLCRPYQVVVKKNRRWFWQSPKYEPTHFQLNQLLVSQDGFDDIKVESRKLTTYNKTYEFDVKGKTGSKLTSIIDLELDGSDSITVEAKFGEITKLEVDQPAFMSKVAERCMDVKHQFLDQVKADPRKTLCVVVGSAQLTADGTIHMHIKKEGEAKEEAGAKEVTNEEAVITVGDKGDKDLVIPALTPLAFNLCELLVRGNGSMELMVEENSLGGFEDIGDSEDGPQLEGILEGMSLEEQYGALMQLPKPEKYDLRNAILNICTTPADIDPLLKLLKEAQRSTGATQEKTGQLKVKGEMANAEKVLKAAGFKFQGDGTMTYPNKASPLLDVLRSVFEALIELDDNSTVALSKCTRQYAPAIMGVVSAAIDKTPMVVTDKDASTIYVSENTARDFLGTLGFQVEDSAQVVTTLDNHAELEGAYRAVYALLWKKPKAPGGSSLKCNIL